MDICFAYPNRELTYSETFIANHKNGLNAKYNITGGWMPFEDVENGSIFNFPLSNNYLRGALKTFSKQIYFSLYKKAFTEYLKRISPKVVFAEYGITGSNITESCKKIGMPLIVHFHGFDAFHYDTLNKFKLGYEAMFNYASEFIVVSEDMRTQLINLGVTSLKIHKVTCGIDTSKFKSGITPSVNPPIFLSVGRFTDKKAPLLTIRAFSIVQKIHKDARLIMIGEGELFNDAKKYVKDIEIQNFVSFMGIQPPEIVSENLKKARCFVQHSVRAKNGDSEGLPTSILEACATSLPVVSTTHAGIKEAVIQNETGFLTDEGDYETMAKYMMKFIENPSLADEMGKKGQIHFQKNYNLNSQISKLKDVISKYL